MSAQFGICTFDGRPIDVSVAHQADQILSPYAPDGTTHYTGEGITLVHHAFHTTAESRREQQPHVLDSGAVIVWDGRLDNRDSLVHDLGNGVTLDNTDIEIVAASFDRWGTKCFANLMGDWALIIWNARDRVLILARDIAGVRPLYYYIAKDGVWWSSVIDPLVTLSGVRWALDHEYVAGWLALYPEADSTPYVGIRAVPPASFLSVRAQGHSISKYWDFDPRKRIVYKSDAEYEEHFRTVFRQAVRRRLRSDRPIGAELSGGMDSPSILCMADSIVPSLPSGTPTIETLSFYDDSEPHSNERPYFTKVEEKRGRRGCHINLAGQELFGFCEIDALQPMPGGMTGNPTEATRQQKDFLQANNIRVLLSGIGGDEVMGGVPTPFSELQDLMAQGELRQLAHSLKLWALHQRKPWFHLAGQALAGFFPTALVGPSRYLRPAPWLSRDFIERHRYALSGFERRVTLFGPLPSLQANTAALDTLRRQLATKCLSTDPAYEKRFPYLDRDLLEFMFAIPRQQVVRAGYRRSLMRRALAGIVPEEILERKRKAFVSRGPRVAIANEWGRLSALGENMVSFRLGIVDEQAFRNALMAVRDSAEVPLIRLIRTVILEAWLRNLSRNQVQIETDKRLPRMSQIPLSAAT